MTSSEPPMSSLGASGAQKLHTNFDLQTKAELVEFIQSNETKTDEILVETIDVNNISTLVKGHINSHEDYVAIFGPIDWAPFVEMPGIDE